MYLQTTHAESQELKVSDPALYYRLQWEAFHEVDRRETALARARRRAAKRLEVTAHQL
jgi:hypothetical protein